MIWTYVFYVCSLKVFCIAASVCGSICDDHHQLPSSAMREGNAVRGHGAFADFGSVDIYGCRMSYSAKRKNVFPVIKMRKSACIGDFARKAFLPFIKTKLFDSVDIIGVFHSKTIVYLICTLSAQKRQGDIDTCSVFDIRKII